jgi:flagellum-specific peptidoglycan hydrolase FlgJ
MAGLMNQTNTKSELLTAIRTAFGPRSGETYSLQQRIEGLTQSQLQTVLTYAQLVKMAQSYSFGNAQTYKQLVDSMYPNMQFSLRSIVADLLQDAEPIEVVSPVEPEPTPRELSKEFYDNLTPLPALKPAKRYPETDAEISELLTNLMREAYGDERTDKASVELKPKENAPFKDKSAFLKALTPVAKEVAADLGVSHKIILAQAALESSWGKAASGSNNLMGIKSHGLAGGKAVATTEVIDGKTVKLTDNFRQYNSPEDSIRGYGSFLKSNKRYRHFLNAGADNEDAQLTALQQSGYATDPKYAQKLKSIVKGLPSGDDA